MLFHDRFRRLVGGASASGPTKKISMKIAAPLVASVALSSGVLALEPARAQAVAMLESFSCSSSSPCVTLKNKGSGAALQATAAGDSIHGIATGSGKSGVVGETDSKSGGYGVKGTNTVHAGTAVYGAGGVGTGVLGTTTSNNLFGVEGVATNEGIGVLGSSQYDDGVGGRSTSGYGVEAFSSSNYGLFASSNSSEAVNAQSNSGTSATLEVDNFGTVSKPNAGSPTYFQADGAHIYSQNGDGALIESGDVNYNGITSFTEGGGYGAIIGSTNDGLLVAEGNGINGYPLFAGGANPDGTVTGTFQVDGSGNIRYSGTASSFARTRDGAKVTAFETKATQAGFEDSGTAQLVRGSAFVSLDPAFARGIDMRSPYRVFLTPDGDTRGLYVAGKTPAGFTVRETQGGRGSFAFDYRILASAAGGTGERTTLVTPAVEARFFPMLATHGRKNKITLTTHRPMHRPTLQRAPTVPAP